MIDANDVKFPITLAEFTRMQQASMHRFPTTNDMEIFAQIVDTANEAYHAAAEGDSDTVADILYAINISAAETPKAGQVAAVCRSWVLIAAKAGMEVLRKKMAE